MEPDSPQHGCSWRLTERERSSFWDLERRVLFDSAAIGEQIGAPHNAAINGLLAPVLLLPEDTDRERSSIFALAMGSETLPQRAWRIGDGLALDVGWVEGPAVPMPSATAPTRWLSRGRDGGSRVTGVDGTWLQAGSAAFWPTAVRDGQGVWWTNVAGWDSPNGPVRSAKVPATYGVWLPDPAGKLSFASGHRIYDATTGATVLDLRSTVDESIPWGESFAFTMVVGAGPRLVFVGGKRAVFTRADDASTATAELPGLVLGPPCSGDLDGDGVVEVVIASRSLLANHLTAVGLDGVLRWSVDLPRDRTWGASCSVADLDGDRRDEVLTLTEHLFAVLDGTTGSTLLLDESVGEATLFGYPVVADLDRDGSSEILVVSGLPRELGDGQRKFGIFEYFHPEALLQPHPSVWPGSHAHATTLAPDGAVLVEAAPWWEDASTDGHQRMASSAACSRFVVGAVEVCTTGDSARFRVQMQHVGGPATPTKVAVQVFDREGLAATATADVATRAPIELAITGGDSGPFEVRATPIGLPRACGSGASTLWVENQENP